MDFQALPADPSSLVFTACAAGREVWRTDGTAAGTVALTSGSEDRCDAGTGDTGLGLTPAGGFLFFWRTDGFYARDLWRTDGTVPGTLRLTAGGNLQKNPMAAFQGRLFFAVNTSGGPAVWSSDGTPAGTAQAFQVPTSDGGAEITGLTALAGSLWFILPNQGDDRHSELWRSDGTPAGTVRIGGIPGAAPPLAALGNQVFFLGQQPHNGLGSVWRTDGTPAGTYPLINNAYAGDGVFDHPQMAVAAGSLYFIARSASGPFPFRPTLYKSDGTPLGTFPLAPTAATSAVGLPPAYLTAAAGRLFFAADDGVHGLELWTSDGTAAGTRLVRDIAPGPASSNPDGLAAAGGLLYFSADDGVHGAELWRSDGTEAGTRLAQDIAPEADSSFPQLLTAAGGRLWLSADDGATGRELWSLPLATASACQPSPAHLCLGAGGRYQVEAAWHTAAGARGRGTAVALTADTGTFWFFSPTNVEAVVKVLDGTGVNGHVWVFYGALSNVEYTLTVTDTQTGLTRRYFNPQGQLASVGDVYGFGPLGANGASPHPPVTTAAPSPLPLVAEKTDRAATVHCQASAQRLCLNGGRFAVDVVWKDFQSHTGKGTAVPLTADTGTFWFFNASNVELVVKALDGRPVNGHFWLFYGALSNVQYTLTVTDTQTGKIKTYTNPAGRFASVADTLAF
jgi:ELWxxDGT repeat protein